MIWTSATRRSVTMLSIMYESTEACVFALDERPHVLSGLREGIRGCSFQVPLGFIQFWLGFRLLLPSLGCCLALVTLAPTHRRSAKAPTTVANFTKQQTEPESRRPHALQEARHVEIELASRTLRKDFMQHWTRLHRPEPWLHLCDLGR